MLTRDLKKDVSDPPENYTQDLPPLSQDVTYCWKNKRHINILW